MSNGEPMKNPWLIIIPARLNSTRLPLKPLADLCGKPLIIRVVENIASLAGPGVRIVVATDSEDIANLCKSENIAATLTSASHESGTDRCAEVARTAPESYVMNLQGDEPFADPSTLKTLMEEFEASDSDMATLAFKCHGSADLNNPSLVKVVVTSARKALYFSRSPIPFYRDSSPQSWLQHQGVYVFKKDSLMKFVAMRPSPLELAEKLEQLRALEGGMSILVVESKVESIGIDTPEDLLRAQSLYGARR